MSLSMVCEMESRLGLGVVVVVVVRMVEICW